MSLARAFQPDDLASALDRIAGARSPEEYNAARDALFALDVGAVESLIRELGEPHSAEATLALEEFLLAKAQPGILIQYALDPRQPSLIRASMAGLLGRLALESSSFRQYIRAFLEQLKAAPDPRISTVARDALSDLG